MDKKDFRLLVALGEDARQSLQALGRRVGLSAPAVRDRIARLKERGIIQGYWLSMDPAIVGRANLLLNYAGEFTRAQAAAALAAPEVAWVAWKIDGALTVQLFTADEQAAAARMSKLLGGKPAWSGLSQSGWTGRLTAADWRIVDALIDDPLMPVAALAQAVNLSPKTVRKRLGLLTSTEAVYIVAHMGYADDAGDLVFDLAVSGPATFAQLHPVIGDAFLIHEVTDPPRKYMMCRAGSLGELSGITHNLEKLRGVTEVRVSINRELILARDFHHALVRERIAAASPRAP